MKKYMVILFTSLSVIGGAITWYFLGQKDVAGGEGQVIGTLVEKNNDVKFKHQNGFFYSEAQKGTSLYEESEVITASDSTGFVVLENAIQIDIPEETLIKISSKKSDTGDELVLNILNGKVQIAAPDGAPKSLRLQTSRGDLNLTLEAGAKVLFDKTVDDGTGVSIIGLAGKTQLKAGEETLSLENGETVSLKNGSRATEGQSPFFDEKVKVVLLPELPNSTSTIYRTQRISFKWQSKDNQNLSVQISKTDSFKKLFKSIDVAQFTEFFISSDDFEPGNYFWRLEKKLDSGSFVYSPSLSFTVLTPSKTVLSKPMRTFVSRGEWAFEIGVQKSVPQKKYHFQLARDDSFKNIFDEYEGSSPMKSYVDNNGSFFIRAREKLSDQDYGPWSDTERDVIRPPLESLVAELENQFFDKKTGTLTLNLKWETVPNAVEYLVQLSYSSTFEKIVASAKTSKNSYTLRGVFTQPGYVRVLALSKEGEISPTKDVFRTKGVLTPPVIEKLGAVGPVLDQPGSQAQLHLLWKHLEGFTKYTVEVSKNENMTGAKSVETDNIELYYPIDQEGWYYVRVSGVPESSRFYAMESGVRAIQYTKPVPLLQTKKFLPKDNEVYISPPKVQFSVRFIWQEIPEAQWYVLELSKTQDFKSAKSYKADGHDYTLKDRLSSGRWFYRIKARNPQQEAPWSSVGVLYIGS